MILYTSQFYYKGDDRLDITYRANHILSPSKNIVTDFKYNNLPESVYERLYIQRITRHFKTRRVEVKRFLALPQVTIVCYCPSNKFCHRFLAAKWLVQEFDVEYKGEI